MKVWCGRRYPDNEVRVISRHGDDTNRRWCGYYVINNGPKPSMLTGVSVDLWTRFHRSWPYHTAPDDPYHEKLWYLNTFLWIVFLVMLFIIPPDDSSNKDSVADKPWYITLFTIVAVSAIYVTYKVAKQTSEEYQDMLKSHIESFSPDFCDEGITLTMFVVTTLLVRVQG